jgi:deferrochelatase/peroxidase EfeB
MSMPLFELEDIQSGVLSPRPSPYVATYILFRIDDRKVGREMMQKLNTVVASVGDQTSPAGDAWVSVSLTFQGLKALGVPQESLDIFPLNFDLEWLRGHMNLGARERALLRSGRNHSGQKTCT